MTKIKNISGKVINFGEVIILPGQEKEIPKNYEKSPVIETYKRLKFIEASVDAQPVEEVTASYKAPVLNEETMKSKNSKK